MLSRERVLEALLELTGGPVASTRGDLLRQVLQTTLPLVQADGATLIALHQGRFERLAATADHHDLDSTPASWHDREVTRRLLHVSQPLRVADLAQDPRLQAEDGCPGVDAGPALVVPMRRREHAPGCLAAFRRRGAAPFTSADARQLVLLAAWAAAALENLRLAGRVEKLAVTDDLTQVYNYRFLKTALKRELKRAARFGQELALVMLDVDNLKGYNDRNGHMRGSLLLRELAGLFAQNVRSFDLVAKYGGDEFTLILPQTDREGACVVAERMRSVVSSHTFPLAPTGSITVSLGVAVFPEDATDPMGLIQASDRALYAAKRRGRNRVETVRELAA